jgi:hypothetical protein
VAPKAAAETTAPTSTHASTGSHPAAGVHHAAGVSDACRPGALGSRDSLDGDAAQGNIVMVLRHCPIEDDRH